MPDITVEDIRNARMMLPTVAEDGTIVMVCEQFPELTRIDARPAMRQYLVAGEPVVSSYEAIVAAINAYRAANAAPSEAPADGP